MCEKHKFVQIHCHTSASNLDGAARGQALVERAKQFGHPAMAITDHGSPAGLYEHYKACKKAGIKPILGLEFYITNDLESRIAMKGREFESRDFHQSVYVKNKQGYKNFNYLTYISHTDGYYYKPRIDFNVLFDKSEGLMTTTSCIASKINNYITAGMDKDAEELFKQFHKAFGDDYYGEIQFNELNDRSKWGIDQRANNEFIIKMCNKYDVPILIGGDVHYLDNGDAELQDALINSKRQAKEGEEGFQIHARHLYFHDVSDYYDFDKKFGYNYGTDFLEKCFENSVKFADKVDFEFETGKYHVPKINTGTMSEKDYLEKITWEGITRRIESARKHEMDVPNHIIETYESKIPYELKVIDDLGLNGYLLVVQDIINWEKKQGIFVGPGRGSAAGSIVAYAIGITDMCPVEHNLLFERFINPNRKTMADIDWDQEEGSREKVLGYLVETYGQNSVCNVATFGQYAPKSALKDMSRGLRKDTATDGILNKKICKLPEVAEEGVKKWKPKPGEMISYFEKVHKETIDPEIKLWIEDNRDTIRLADKLQGQMKSIGTHAGGIVVTPEPIYNLVPVMKGSGNLVTAFREADGSSKDLSDLGILKLDVLGLKTLNVLKECVLRIKEDTGLDLYEKIYHLKLDDPNLIKAFASGKNFGIFQMDRSAMFTSRFKNDGGGVDSFEDIVAINAMNRPGPLEKFLPKYGVWKHMDKHPEAYEQEELDEADAERYPFPFMKNSLSQTYGCLDKDEKIYIPSIGNYKAIKDVVNGEKIVSKSGNGYTTANNKLTIHRGINDIYEYTLKTGYTLRVTSDHKINTLYGEMSIGEAYNKGISIMLPRRLTWVENTESFELFDLTKARLMGLMLADGNFKSTNIVFTNSERVLSDGFKQAIEFLYKECKVTEYHKKNETFDYVVSGIQRRKNAFMDELKALGLKGKGSKDKFIPLEYFTRDVLFKLHLLAGLWDGDGGVTEYNAYYKTKSKQLAEDIVTICRQLGMLPIIKYNKDESYRVVLDLDAYSMIAEHMLLDYKKPTRVTHPYYNQPDKVFLQDAMRDKFGSERGYYKTIDRKRKNSGSFYKDQLELRSLFNNLNMLELFDNNYFVQIESEKFVKHDEVYDLSIDGEPWFVAGHGGILVHNCLLYQEQFMQMICDVTGMTFGDADSFRRAIAWREDNPKFYTVKGYFDRLEQSMLDQNYTKEDVAKFLQYCRDFMGYSFNRSHSVVYSYISWQTLFFKHYYPTYFFAAMLNSEDKTDAIQNIIEDAKNHGMDILPLNVAESEYHTKSEGENGIRLGYQLIKGLGNAVEAELKELELHKCKTIDQILQKPFKKINATTLNNLIRLGCFDGFDVPREMVQRLKELYKEPKIEKWFSRKRSPAEEKTMPPILSENFDVSMVMDLVPSALDSAVPHIALVKSLTPYLASDNKVDIEVLQKATIMAEMELLGFPVTEDEMFKRFALAYSSDGALSIDDFEEGDDPNVYYFKIIAINELKTKKGKTYWSYVLSSGRKEIKAKVWNENTKAIAGAYCIGVLSHDDWGFSLKGCQIVK